MHAHTPDCPLTCLKPHLTAAAYNLLRSECLLICGDAEPATGHAVRLYLRGQLADIRYIGPARFAEIRTCLASAGLIGHDEADESCLPAPQAASAADAGQPPHSPAGEPAGASSRLRTRLITE
jgi:hypothetical protein